MRPLSFLKYNFFYIQPVHESSPSTMSANAAANDSVSDRDGSIPIFQPIPILECLCQPIPILEFLNYL